MNWTGWFGERGFVVDIVLLQPFVLLLLPGN